MEERLTFARRLNETEIVFETCRTTWFDEWDWKSEMRINDLISLHVSNSSMWSIRWIKITWMIVTVGGFKVQNTFPTKQTNSRQCHATSSFSHRNKSLSASDFMKPEACTKFIKISLSKMNGFGSEFEFAQLFDHISRTVHISPGAPYSMNWLVSFHSFCFKRYYCEIRLIIRLLFILTCLCHNNGIRHVYHYLIDDGVQPNKWKRPYDIQISKPMENGWQKTGTTDDTLSHTFRYGGCRNGVVLQSHFNIIKYLSQFSNIHLRPLFHSASPPLCQEDPFKFLFLWYDFVTSLQHFLLLCARIVGPFTHTHRRIHVF